MPVKPKIPISAEAPTGKPMYNKIMNVALQQKMYSVTI